VVDSKVAKLTLCLHGGILRMQDGLFELRHPCFLVLPLYRCPSKESGATKGGGLGGGEDGKGRVGRR